MHQRSALQVSVGAAAVDDSSLPSGVDRTP